MATAKTNFHDLDKLEKSFPVIRHNNLRFVANAFRFLEVCLAIGLFYWIFAQLPVAVGIISEYSRQILSFFSRPLVVFVFFNAIVAAVASKTDRLGDQTPSDGDYTDDLYEEMVKLNESRSNLSTSQDNQEHKEIIFQDKQIVISSTPAPRISSVSASSGSEKAVKCPKVYRRTKSEKMPKRHQMAGTSGRQLRRSETTKLRNVGFSVDHEFHWNDELSNDEFQRAIEEFIAKQLRFHREESMAIVLK